MNKLVIIMLFAYVYAGSSYGCDDHATPDMLPLPLNGGKLTPAHDKVEHKGGDHHHGEELYFETLYKDGKIMVYPLALAGEKHDSFKVLSPKKHLKKVEIIAESKRPKKVEKLTLKMMDDVIEAKFDTKKAHHFVAHITAVHENEAKVAEVKIEKK